MNENGKNYFMSESTIDLMIEASLKSHLEDYSTVFLNRSFELEKVSRKVVMKNVCSPSPLYYINNTILYNLYNQYKRIISEF